MGEREPSHYDRLGVTPAASTEEIRSAYRALAGRLHPDRLQHASEPDRRFAERRMREVNEAWHVLRDPGRRREYDTERRALASRPRTTTDQSVVKGTRNRPGTPSRRDDEADLDDSPPVSRSQARFLRHLPWVVVALLLGGIFVVSAYADRDRDRAPTGPRTAAVGDCLDIPSGTATTIVPCTGEHDYVVVAQVPTVESCPAGSEARRLGNDAHFDCLRPR